MRTMTIVAVVALMLIAGVGLGVAYGPRWGGGMHSITGGRDGAGLMDWNGTANSTWSRGAYQEQMEEIIEEGTYDDLVRLREQTGRPLMRWVQDEETFEQARERHAQMEELYGEGPHYGKAGGCPMRQQ